MAEEQGEGLMELRVELERVNELLEQSKKELETIKAEQKNPVEPGPSKVTEK